MDEWIIIIQGRTLSSRLPKKILLPIYREKSIIDILLDRLSNIKYNIQHNYNFVKDQKGLDLNKKMCIISNVAFNE